MSRLSDSREVVICAKVPKALLVPIPAPKLSEVEEERKAAEDAAKIAAEVKAKKAAKLERKRTKSEGSVISKASKSSKAKSTR